MQIGTKYSNPYKRWHSPKSAMVKPMLFSGCCSYHLQVFSCHPFVWVVPSPQYDFMDNPQDVIHGPSDYSLFSVVLQPYFWVQCASGTLHMYHHPPALTFLDAQLHPVRGVIKKSDSGGLAVTSNPSVAGRSFIYQSYKSHQHGCDGAMFDNIRFVCHRPTWTQSQDTAAFYFIA